MPRRTHRINGRAYEDSEPLVTNKCETAHTRFCLHSAPCSSAGEEYLCLRFKSTPSVIAGVKGDIQKVNIVRVVPEDANLEAADYLSCLVEDHTGWKEGVSWWVEDPELDASLVKRHTVDLDWNRLVPLGDVPSIRAMGLNELILTTHELLAKEVEKPAWWMPHAPFIVPSVSPTVQFAFTYEEVDNMMENGVKEDDVQILRSPREKLEHIKSEKELLVRDFSHWKSLQVMRSMASLRHLRLQGWFCKELTVVTIHTLMHNEEKMHLLGFDLPEVLLHRSLFTASVAGPST